MKTGIRLAAAAALFALAGCGKDPEPTPVKVTVYDAFGPDMSYQNNIGWSLSGPASENISNGAVYAVEQAFSFPGKAGTLSDVWVSLGYYTWQRKPSVITFSLDEDANGLPGRTLESWKVTAGFHLFDSTVAPIRLKGNGRTALLDNRTYWLRGTADDSSWVGWDFNPDPARTCQNTERRADGKWDPAGNVTCSVFRIEAEN